MLDDIESDLRSLALADVSNKDEYLSAVLRVFLKKIYTGDEENAWKFFNTNYQLSDRIEVKSDIRKALRHDPIYRSIYKR